MNLVESVEYFTSCPQCGATNNGKELCEYCGTSLIKRRINQSINTGNSDIEEANMEEDYDLREISGKIAEIDPFILLFCLIFGAGFIVTPLIICIAFASTGISELWVYLMLSLFFAIGFGAMVPLILSIVNKSKCKNGIPVSGVVRGYTKSLVTVNGSPVLNMRLRMYEGDEAVILVLRTGSTQREYKVGTTVHLKRYNNKYLFDKEKMRRR